MNFGLKPRCECGKSFKHHLTGKACEEYTPRQGMAQVSTKQGQDQEILNRMRQEHLAILHELFGTEECAAKGKLKHMCFGQLVLDHVNLKATRSLKFDMKNTQILCEVANGMKGSKRTDYRSPEIKKALEDRYPTGTEFMPERTNP